MRNARSFWSTERAIAFAIVALCGAVLLVGWWLEPDAAGVGTHRQLGLGSCSVLSKTGWPCPMCGMTTTFALGLDGRLLAAWQNQPFGVFLLTNTVSAFLVAFCELVRPAARLTRGWAWVERHDSVVAAALLLGLTFGWLYKCWILGVFS